MTTFPKSFDPQTLAKLKSFRLRARHVVEGFLAGAFRNPRQGFSIEFAEHREYAAGDDLRYLDWRAFGRTDKYYLKRFDDETNFTSYVLLDQSQSMSYRGPQAALTKYEYGQCVAAALAWLVWQRQNAIGVGCFDNQVRSFVRPSANRGQLNLVLRQLDGKPSRHATNYERVLHELSDRIQRRSVLILIGDFLDRVDNVLKGLSRLAHQRHDISLFHTLDPSEWTFDFQGELQFQGLEGEGDVNVDAAGLRATYLSELQKYQTTLRVGCQKMGIDYQNARTDFPLDRVLTRYLTHRK